MLNDDKIYRQKVGDARHYLYTSFAKKAYAIPIER